MSNFEDVKKFMVTFSQVVRTKPQFPDDKTMQLRFDLIKEELNELEHAMKTKNLKEIADALTDILYVTYGAGYAYGINLDKCFYVFKITHKFISPLYCSPSSIYQE